MPGTFSQPFMVWETDNFIFRLSGCFNFLCYTISGKTLGAGLSLGHLGENGEAGSRESSQLVGHHVSTDVNSWWNEQIFILEKCE